MVRRRPPDLEVTDRNGVSDPEAGVVIHPGIHTVVGVQEAVRQQDHVSDGNILLGHLIQLTLLE